MKSDAIDNMINIQYRWQRVIASHKQNAQKMCQKIVSKQIGN